VDFFLKNDFFEVKRMSCEHFIIIVPGMNEMWQLVHLGKMGVSRKNVF
jgi:hypothetical protein